MPPSHTESEMNDSVWMITNFLSPKKEQSFLLGRANISMPRLFSEIKTKKMMYIISNNCKVPLNCKSIHGLAV